MTPKFTRQGVPDLGGNCRIVPTCSHPRTEYGTKLTTAWSSVWGDYDTHIKTARCAVCHAPLKHVPKK
jgi:putative component of membrane protein insertase Oxa1/YidC/SpoIIIJ protein YidD